MSKPAIAIPRLVPHACSGLYWYSNKGACNEEGWKCVDCGVRPGEPPGYSPADDVAHLDVKVGSILHDLVDANIISVSNATDADCITAIVTRKVRESGNLDQYTIVKAILDELTPSHAKYWRERGDAIRKRADDRDRCACGKLSKCTTIGNPNIYTCGERDCPYTSAQWERCLIARARRCAESGAAVGTLPDGVSFENACEVLASFHAAADANVDMYEKVTRDLYALAKERRERIAALEQSLRDLLQRHDSRTMDEDAIARLRSLLGKEGGHGE